MEEDKKKLVGFKADTDDHTIIGIRADKEGIDASKLYRRIIDEYFERNPLTEAEKSFLK